MFVLHDNEPVGGTHFHMNGFALRLVLKQRQNGNLEMAYCFQIHCSAKFIHQPAMPLELIFTLLRWFELLTMWMRLKCLSEQYFQVVLFVALFVAVCLKPKSVQFKIIA